MGCLVTEKYTFYYRYLGSIYIFREGGGSQTTCLFILWFAFPPLLPRLRTSSLLVSVSQISAVSTPSAHVTLKSIERVYLVGAENNWGQKPPRRETTVNFLVSGTQSTAQGEDGERNSGERRCLRQRGTEGCVGGRKQKLEVSMREWGEPLEKSWRSEIFLHKSHLLAQFLPWYENSFSSGDHDAQ